MTARFSTLVLVASILLSLTGFGISDRPAFAATSLRCKDMVDVNIPGTINKRFSTINLTCFRFRIAAGLTRLSIYLKPAQAVYNVYFGIVQSPSANILIDTTRRSSAQVNRGSQAPFRPSTLTPGFLILAMDPASGGAEGDTIRVKTEIPAPPPAPAPSNNSGIGSVSQPIDSSVIVDLSPASVATIALGKAKLPVILPDVAVVPAAPAAPAEPPTPTPTTPPPEAPAEPEAPASPAEPAAPVEQPSAPQPQPATNNSGGDSFPCSRAGIGKSNLCIEQPYPVARGSTAYVVWNIADFTYGEFDRGDGQGYKGPIYKQQRVEVPGINEPRTIRLRWKDSSGALREDTFTIQVAN